MSTRYLRRAALLASLALAACATDAVTTADQPLEGAAWRLARLGADGPQVAASQQEPFVQFDGTARQVSGSGGCNRLMGSYETADGRLKIGPLASTRMACLDEATGARETRFLAALEATAGYRIEGRTLTLLNGQGQPVAVLEEATKR